MRHSALAPHIAVLVDGRELSRRRRPSNYVIFDHHSQFGRREMVGEHEPVTIWAAYNSHEFNLKLKPRLS